MRRRLPIAALALLLLAALLGWWVTRPTQEPDVTGASVRPVAPAPLQPRPMAPDPHEVPPAPEPAPPPLQGALRAHARAAETLGLVAIRCQVGSQLDSMKLFGPFEPRVEDGWFSTLVATLEGSQLVHGWEPDAGPDAVQPLFQVRWSAQEPGSSVPCQVDWLDYAEVVATVVDEEGAPVESVHVTGCGDFEAPTGPDGTTRGEVVATDRCTLFAIADRSGGRPPSMGRVDVTGLKIGEVRRVQLVLSPMSELKAFAPRDDVEYLLDPLAPPAELLEQVDAVRGLLPDAEGSEAEVLARLADAIENKADQMQVIEELKGGLEELDGALEDHDLEGMMETIERSEELMEELDALHDEARGERRR